MTINRHIQPATQPITSITMPPMEQYTCANGIPLYVINTGEEAVIRIDLIFAAGSWQQEKRMVSMIANSMLREGTTTFSSPVIADKLDFYGASLQTTATHHNSYVTLYALTKHAIPLLALLEELVMRPTFPEKELRTIMNRRKQAYLVDCEKVNFLASKSFINAMFGDDHPYGRTARIDDFDAITSDDLRSFYHNYYHSANCKIVLSGRITPEMRNEVERTFGKGTWGEPKETPLFTHTIQPSAEHIIFTEKKDAMQSGIRLGVHTIRRSHEDFPKLDILNTIFGGYFGSRLMSNIREDKGYTYGIGSGITVYQEAAYLSVSTQAACAVTRPLIQEVFNEIDRLQNELVEEDELEMVKNYITGELCRSLEGPFSIADQYISNMVSGVGPEYIQKQVEAIHTVTPEELQILAQKYLKQENFYQIVAGNME